jgi:hypothetical protein
MTRLTRRKCIAVACVAFLLAGSVQAWAASVLDLGPPTNDVPPYLPLGSFRHASRLALTSGGKAEVLWIGTQVDPLSAAERWAVVKTLEQFGTLSGVTTSSTPTCTGQTPNDPCQWPVPTFDWSHAHYRSAYVSFVHRDLLDRNGKPAQPLTRAERSLFDRYVGLPASTFQGSVQAVLANSQHVLAPGLGVGQDETRRFPLLAVSGYLQSGVGALIPSDFVALNTHPSMYDRPQNDTPLSFATVQQALIRGKLTGPGPTSLVPDINIETNILTTLICHVDRLRPAKVCNRPVIRQLLRRGT